jgi:hypothetical protein
MQKTLGVFVSKEQVALKQEFFKKTWTILQSGPDIIRARRCGNCEPLRPVGEVNLNKMFAEQFFTSNGRRSSCSVWPPSHLSHFFCIIVFLHLRNSEDRVAQEVYTWLKESFNDSISYMGTPTQEMFDGNLELHQILNRGAAGHELPKLRAFKNHLDIFYDVA